MSIPTLLRILTRKQAVAVTCGQKMSVAKSSKSAGPALLPGRFRRKGEARTSYLNTGYLNDHVLKDIGLERSDLTKPG
jgi:uncharacterized protein YjiS (DUF1127 family)